MSIRLSIMKGASVLTVSQAVVAASTFFRNVIIARHIDTEQYGIATTFALTVSLVEMTSNLALDRVLVQDSEGDGDDMLGSAHLLQFIKGLLIAAVLFLIATPVATIFGLPHLIGAFQLLAVVPALQGLMHFDFVVRQRQMEFFPTALYDALPQILTLAIAFVAARVFDDYRVMLAVIIVQSALYVLISHLLARRAYRWTMNWRLARRKLEFGWPLLVNGFLMFGIFQGDRVIIGTQYDMHTLGWYSVAFSLCMLPTLIFAKMSGYLLMPILSRNREQGPVYAQCCDFTLIACFCFALFMVTFFAVAGTALIHLSFGEQYLDAASVMLWLAIMQALRIVRIAPSVIANSQARTKNAMYANIFRCTALLLAMGLALRGQPVAWIAASGIVGECLALCVSVYLVELGSHKKKFVEKLAQLAICAGALVTMVVFLADGLGPAATIVGNLVTVLTGAAVAALAAVLLGLSQRAVRAEGLRLWRFARGSSSVSRRPLAIEKQNS
ncbi:oligosaccharide flippase family protein [Microbulbifer hainanensis]|uniref:oligosaccharide flippase family protein n=1 Tax=Microbulbifer hainanensis TaxID=2735675 RepID=UPI001868A9C1|nr:oligosaccharide flippase family protein [Microbulbifer hainanensis]